jgi:glycolate oxidase iron-sulfur subunit
LIKKDVIFGNLNENVTYHDACHLAHTQKIVSQPREVLSMIPGLTHIPLEESTWCCGSAGTYNIIQYDTSMEILKRKMNNIRKTGAGTVLTGNPGCYQQLKYGAEKFDVNIKVEHPVKFIKKALYSSKENT